MAHNQSPPFLYSCITKKKYILCETYTVNNLNLTSSINKIVNQSIKENSGATTGLKNYTQSINNVHFHILFENGINYVVATELIDVAEKAYSYLKSVKNRFAHEMKFEEKINDNSISISKYCLNPQFKTELTSIITQFNNNKKLWASQNSMRELKQVQTQVTEVVEIMRNNIDQVLVRGDALDDMIDRADELQQQTHQFQQQTAQVHRSFWWRDFKWKLIMGTVVIIFLSLIVWWIASFFHHDKEPESS